jgi:hypothetical protein
MSRVRILFYAALLAALLATTLFAGWPNALAQSGDYDLSWWTADGGGGGLAGGGYALSGALGQPDAATWQGGGYRLSGGFWPGGARGAPEEYRVYLPIVVR